MRHNLRSSRFGLLLALPVMIGLPFLLGQACPGTNGLQPVTPRAASSTTLDGTGNASPIFAFNEPSTDVSAEVGQIIPITWTDGDSDDNAAITLLADPDNVLGNGNERVILALVMEDDPANSFDLDTSSLPAATYRLIAKVNDGVNPELIAVSPGRILLLGTGLRQGNISPKITMLGPDINLALAQGDTAILTYCGRDPDGSFNNTAADVLIVLDTDQDPTNDLDLTGPAREVDFLAACSTGGFPRPVGGVLVLGCAKDDGCVMGPNGPVNNLATGFLLTADVSQIPPRSGGQPYWPRVTMWDHTNDAVSSYSMGNISITALGTGTLDLGQVGRTISGTRFLGFDPGALAGSTGTSLGDFDNDGADDFIIVDRFGRPYERGNIGSAFLIYGINGGKFGSEINLNSVGTTYRGTGFAMGVGMCGMTIPATQGITSVASIRDLTNDGRPEILFGMPYVEEMYDYVDDDPRDEDGRCYGDLDPNPLSTQIQNDDMTNFDYREGTVPIPDTTPPLFAACSNDLDFFKQTPINQGYVIYVQSNNPLEGTVIELPLVGQHDAAGIQHDECTIYPGSTAPNGSRFRGGWYDDFDMTQTVRPYDIIPDNQFGQTVASMPDMGNGHITGSKDGDEELLISAPNSYRGKGSVTMTYGQDFVSFDDAALVSSIPTPRRSPGYPDYRTIIGSAIGDHLGNAGSAGDFNLDGSPDILCGAPGAERGGLAQSGIVYVIFGRIDFGDMNLGMINPPRVEIHGIAPGDRFGEQQALVGDINADGVPDIGLASKYLDGPSGVDSGFVGIVFGGRRLTGENVFISNQIGTSQLPGVKFYGNQPNAHAGAILNSAGDFNGDGTGDVMVVAPDEIRQVEGQSRRGVAYLIFGGTHLNNGTFSLSQVGSAELPGMVFISPYAAGSADEAPIDWAGTAGDVNGDGFSDVLVSVSHADFVNPLEPTQRRVDAGEVYLIYGSNTGTNRLNP